MVPRVYYYVGEETVVRLETEHVDCISTFLKESTIILLHQLDRILEEGLRVERVRVEVQG